jgi:hypothetical protein
MLRSAVASGPPVSAALFAPRRHEVTAVRAVDGANEFSAGEPPWDGCRRDGHCTAANRFDDWCLFHSCTRCCSKVTAVQRRVHPTFSCSGIDRSIGSRHNAGSAVSEPEARMTGGGCGDRRENTCGRKLRSGVSTVSRLVKLMMRQPRQSSFTPHGVHSIVLAVLSSAAHATCKARRCQSVDPGSTTCCLLVRH